MTTQEKVLYNVGSLMLIVGALLHISHTGERSVAWGIILVGVVMGFVANRLNNRRLVGRVRELEIEVQQLRSERM